MVSSATKTEEKVSVLALVRQNLYNLSKVLMFLFLHAVPVC